MIRNRAFVIIGSVGIAALCAASSARASVVNYSTCPGYPFSACPPTWTSYPITETDIDGVTAELYVAPDGENFITDVNALVFITHSWQGDLRIVLTSPAGTSVELVNRAGSPGCGSGFSADDFGTTATISGLLHEFVLDDSAPAPYNTPNVGCPGIQRVEGAWRPTSPLSAFNGESKAGVWKLFVQDLASGDTGNLWVWGMTIRTEPPTPPVVDISIPEDFACSCANSQILGTATDPDGTFGGYRLEWAVDSAGPWNLISAGSTPISAAALGALPGAVPEGYAYLRLVATNVLGLSSAFSKVIYVDRSFSSAGFVEPTAGQLVGGSVCMDKVSVSDQCWASASLAYAPQGGGYTTFFTTTNPAQPLPVWNAGALPDGSYTLRVTGTSVCGNVGQGTVNVTVDNTPPIALITAPTNCDYLDGVVAITGTVSDAHLSGWTLQYTGGNTNGWVTIASGTNNLTNGLLANWDTNGLPWCSYTVRLIASDAVEVSCFGGHSTEYDVSVSVGCPGDVNLDGAVNNFDIDPFVSLIINGCP